MFINPECKKQRAAVFLHSGENFDLLTLISLDFSKFGRWENPILPNLTDASAGLNPAEPTDSARSKNS
jgi:hypothetical protein